MDRADLRVPGTERSSLVLLRADVLEALGAGRLSLAVDTDRLARGQIVADTAAFAPVDEVLRVGDHGGEVAVHRAAEIGDRAVVEIGLRADVPVRAARNRGPSAADNHP